MNLFALFCYHCFLRSTFCLVFEIVNTGSTPMRYLSLSNLSEIEVCEYPDSNKVGVHADQPTPGLHKMYRAEVTVEYYDRESTEPPEGAA